ncbi:MAG: glycosyltransferase family 2 protein [Bacteroidetes bacterium]|nr:glycosyltransferase family 2 protein [Bacteroidota bacterium]
MQEFWHYFELIFLILIGIQVFYSLIFALAAHIPRKLRRHSEQEHRICILIPSYKEDVIILQTAKQALDLDYPKHLMNVVVGSDQMKAETVETLREMGAEVVVMNFEHSTKSKNLLSQLQSQEGDKWPDYFLILDADNRMDSNGLRETNTVLHSDIPVYQLHRTAKNNNTKLAVLDGITEGIANNIFREGHRNLGISSALIGSGMVFEANLLKETLENINKDSAVEDKLFEFYLLENRKTIEFVPHIPVYDEKVSQGKNFSNQRKRWIAGQFHAFRVFFFPGLKALLKGNIGFFDKMLQMGLVPKLLFAVLLFMLALLAFVLKTPHAIWYWYLGLYAFTLFICIPKSYFKWKNIGILFELPKAAFFMVLAILRIKRNQSVKTFEHTQKEYVGEDSESESK